MITKNNKSNFNQVLWLGVGQLLTYLVTFLISVILSRYFNKEDYGTFRQVLFIYNILYTVFSSGLATAYSYFIPRLNDNESKTIVSKITNILVIFGILLSLVLFVGADYIALLMKNSSLSDVLRLFCLTPLFSLPALGVESLYTAIRNTKLIAIYQIISKLLIFICCVLPVVIFGMGYKEAIIGWTIASFISFIFAFILKWLPYKQIKSNNINEIYLKIAKYAMPLMAASAVGLLLNSATQFFISRYWGSEVFADYSNGYIGLPVVAMVVNPIKNLLQPIFSKADKDNTLNEALIIYQNGVIHCTKVLIPLIFFSYFFSKDIICFVYGESYILSVPYFRLSLLSDIINIFPYLAIILAFGKTNIYFKVHLVAAILLWGIDILLVFLYNSPLMFASAYTFIKALIPIVSLIYIICKLKINVLSKTLLLNVGKICLHSLVILFIVCLISQLYVLEFSIFVKLILNFTFFIVILVFTGRTIKIEYYTDILKKFFKTN